MPEIESLHDFLGKHPMYHRQLAELMGVKTCTVDRWSNQTRRVTERTLKELNRLHHLLSQNPQLREKYVKSVNSKQLSVISYQLSQ
ncbi:MULTISPECIES: hypothetical protein [Nostoc]|uniref:Uncharacterized protein n=2 Tax=Nostoc TaxID=1177 RepID=A0ABR8IEC5_9NOSO|nr:MULTISPECIES: hypothetical protein [Nostoc]MBD2565902.1 hypothetical protein [Nostoc linckia FACHB-391]MBD2649880.1 hypothetical protein [Nostoc foliaceum FACHB-393]